MRLIDQFDSKDLYILKIFITHFQEKKTCITSDHLSGITGRTSRTIKDDIKRISQLLERWNVAKIVSKKGEGYRIVPLDSEVYQKFSTTIQVYSEFYGKQNLDAFKRRIFLLKILLADGKLTLDKLSDMLFINKTTLYKDMNEVKTMLNTWGVRVRSSSRGIEIIDCGELVYRMLIIDVSQDFLYETSGFDNFSFLNEYTSSLIGTKEEYKQIRKPLLDYLREINFVVRDYHANALALYVCIMKKRMAQGAGIDWLPEKYRSLESSKEYKIAEKILKITGVKPVAKEELLSLTALLLCSRDYWIQSDKDAAYMDQKLLEECEELYQYVITNIEEVGSNFWSDIIHSEPFRENKAAFFSEFIRIFVNVKYGYSGASKLIHIFEAAIYDFSQLAMEISRLLLYFIQKKYDVNICGKNFPMLICLVEVVLNQLSLRSGKKRIAVCSYLGRVISHQEAEYLTERFGAYISSLKVFNLYEIRKENFEDYDLLISDRELLINHYPIPWIYYNFTDPEKESYLLKKVFTEKVSRRFIDKLASITKTIQDVISTNMIRFFKALSLIYGHDGTEDVIFEFLKTKNGILNYGGGPVIFFFLEYTLCRREFIDVYAVKGFAKYAFVVSLDQLVDIHEIKASSMIFDQFLKQEDYVKRLFSDVYGTYEKLLSNINEQT
ncbi:MAG: HTH domain-containing protein [Lachnospiraceae bacterium]|jgi:hypothetical protein|nr:HTH domain-containing protein [Lachnospiraceae bacterium]